MSVRSLSKQQDCGKRSLLTVCSVGLVNSPVGRIAGAAEHTRLPSIGSIGMVGMVDLLKFLDWVNRVCMISMLVARCFLRVGMNSVGLVQVLDFENGERFLAAKVESDESAPATHGSRSYDSPGLRGG
jgi:hypothetical protein